VVARFVLEDGDAVVRQVALESTLVYVLHTTSAPAPYCSARGTTPFRKPLRLPSVNRCGRRLTKPITSSCCSARSDKTQWNQRRHRDGEISKRKTDEAVNTAGDRSSKLPNRSANVTEHDIARRAYELYRARDREHGHEVEDWLQAEQGTAGDAAFYRVSKDRFMPMSGVPSGLLLLRASTRRHLRQGGRISIPTFPTRRWSVRSPP
jgi:Protein of unknown function (DUF2934)